MSHSVHTHYESVEAALPPALKDRVPAPCQV